VKTSWLTASLATLLTLASVSPARSQLAEPRLVRVNLTPQLSVQDLLRAGLDVVHVRGGSEARLLVWPGDEARLLRLGAGVEVLDEHPGRTAALRARADLAARPAAAARRVLSATGTDGVFRAELLPPFGSGSMLGYWTSSEIKTKLDELVANDVNDVVADKIDTLGYTWQGRPLWGLKLGKRVADPDTRPAAYFAALTHAREAEGMQAIFYFVDDLLSRYGADEFATYLLDHRAIYIVPLANPDGYKVNEDYYVAYGSLHYWRKNVRDNNGNMVFDEASDGVDLNRNYGFMWGYDDTGSSPDSSSELYRGPAAFSEPETRAQRDRVIQLAPRTGLSFHTFSDLMLHPWGYVDMPTLDEAAFREWSDELTRDNAYLSGRSPHVLYEVNGEFNDWCYGDTLSKPRMFSWTPEIGSDVDYFWAPPSRILPLAQEMLRPCYVAAALAGPFVQEDGITILGDGAMNSGRAAQILVRARNLGAGGTAGPGLTGTMVPLDLGAHMLVGAVDYPSLGPRQSADSNAPFYVVLADTVTPGRLMRFEIRFTAGDGFFSRDTVAIPAGTPTVLFADDASSGLGKWSPGSYWGIVSGDPDHPSRYFADSPLGTYAPNSNDILRMTTPASLDLSAGVHAYAIFEARWEFEQDYDAACVEASLNGSTWTRLKGSGTTPGSGLTGSKQVPAGQPFYAGNRRTWKPELADLSSFTGPAATAVRFRFRSQSDGYTNFDGFNFDSLRVVLFDPAAQPGPMAVGDGALPAILELAPPAPNPVCGFARFTFALPRAGAVRLEILDVQGRRVRTLADAVLPANRYVRGWDLRDDAGNATRPGVYFVRLSGAAGGAVRRFVLIR
jgi:hypothetical protein